MTSFNALRLNTTAFNFTLNVEYTGGGDITNFAIRFRENDSTDWIPLETQVVPTSSPQSRRSWFGIVASAQFEAIVEVEFEVVIHNARGRSTGTMVVPQELGEYADLNQPIHTHYIAWIVHYRVDSMNYTV